MASGRVTALSFHRDDLRIRSGASGSPHGSTGRNSRERREDGADDHPNKPANSESVLGEPAAEAQSPAAQPHQPDSYPFVCVYRDCAGGSFRIRIRKMLNLNALCAAQASETPSAFTLPDSAAEWSWLRHSLAIDRLWRPAMTETELAEGGVSCGHLAFAALAGLHWEAALLFFPDLPRKPWTNRTAMERALRTIGYEYVRDSSKWPAAGLCLLHFTGPWTRRGYPAAILRYTHWIAVLDDYVFDVNWNGWLPRENWEEVVLEELLTRKLLVEGWNVMTTYEVQNRSDCSISAALQIPTFMLPEEIEDPDFLAQN